MQPVRSASAALLREDGQRGGTLHVTLLPNTADMPVPPLMVGPDAAGGEASIQVVEGVEYRYELDVDEEIAAVEFDRPEVFLPDAEDGQRGRLRPGLYTGTLVTNVNASGGTL